jgi:hypothetical protein
MSNNRKRTKSRNIQTVTGKPDSRMTEANKTQLRVALRGPKVLRQIKHPNLPEIYHHEQPDSKEVS